LGFVVGKETYTKDRKKKRAIGDQIKIRVKKRLPIFDSFSQDIGHDNKHQAYCKSRKLGIK
jgi:hypothetical protein